MGDRSLDTDHVAQTHNSVWTMTIMLLEIHAIVIAIAKAMHMKKSLSGRTFWPFILIRVLTPTGCV